MLHAGSQPWSLIDGTLVHLNWIVYISTIMEYELKCRTLNATVLYGANHDIHSVTTLIFGCGPNGLHHVISWIVFQELT